MQNHAANELHVEVAHVHRTPAGLADYGKGFREDLVEGLLLSRSLGLLFFFAVFDAFGGFGHCLGNPPAELDGLGAQFFVCELLDGWLKGIDFSHNRPKALDNALVCGAKDFS